MFFEVQLRVEVHLEMNQLDWMDARAHPSSTTVLL
jgi:hypothetical protein